MAVRRRGWCVAGSAARLPMTPPWHPGYPVAADAGARRRPAVATRVHCMLCMLRTRVRAVTGISSVHTVNSQHDPAAA